MPRSSRLSFVPTLAALVLPILGSACALTPSDDGESARSQGAAVDYTVFPPTRYRITLSSVDAVSTTEPSGYQGLGYVDWAELGVQLVRKKGFSDNPATTACVLGTARAGSTLGPCQTGATNNGIFTQGQPLSLTVQVTDPTDRVNVAVALDDIETINSNAPVSSGLPNTLATAGDALQGVGGVVALAVEPEGALAGGIIAVVGTVVSVVADSLNTVNNGLGWQTCAGGLMQSPAVGGLNPPDTLMIQLTPDQLAQLTANGPATLDYDATMKVDYVPQVLQARLGCNSVQKLHLTVERDWSTGLAAAPKSGDAAVAKQTDGTNNELDYFATSLATGNTIARSEWQASSGWTAPAMNGSTSTALQSGINSRTEYAAVSRKSSMLDIFWADANGNLNTASKLDAGSSWTNQTIVAPFFTWFGGRVTKLQIVPANAQVAAIARTPSNLDAFFVGTDGVVYNAYWYEGASGWQTTPISPNNAKPGGSVAAVARTPTHIDVVYIANDGSLWTTWWDAGASGWKWYQASSAQSMLAPAGGGVTLAADTATSMSAFFVGVGSAAGASSALWRSYWYDGAPAWNTAAVSGTDGLAQPGTAISSVSRQPGVHDVAYIGGYKVYVTSLNNGAPTTQDIHVSSPTPYGFPGSVSIVARTSWNLDVFFKDVAGEPQTAWWWYGAPAYQSTAL